MNGIIRAIMIDLDALVGLTWHTDTRTNQAACNEMNHARDMLGIGYPKIAIHVLRRIDCLIPPDLRPELEVIIERIKAC